MSTLTAPPTENLHEPADRTTGFRYLLKLSAMQAYQDQTIAVEHVTGTLEELTAGLRPWLLASLNAGSRPGGWYTGFLVATDEEGNYDSYLSLAMEDVVWYWDEECVPLSQLTDRVSPLAPSPPAPARACG